MAEEKHTNWLILELNTSSAEATDWVPAQDGWTSGGARVPGSSSPPLSTHQHCLVTGWHWMGSKLPSFSWHCGRYSCLAGIPVSWAWCSRMARLCWHAKTWGCWWVLHCIQSPMMVSYTGHTKSNDGELYKAYKVQWQWVVQGIQSPMMVSSTGQTKSNDGELYKAYKVQ
jgi:hypothetical protein